MMRTRSLFAITIVVLVPALMARYR